MILQQGKQQKRFTDNNHWKSKKTSKREIVELMKTHYICVLFMGKHIDNVNGFCVILV